MIASGGAGELGRKKKFGIFLILVLTQAKTPDTVCTTLTPGLAREGIKMEMGLHDRIYKWLGDDAAEFACYRIKWSDEWGTEVIVFGDDCEADNAVWYLTTINVPQARVAARKRIRNLIDSYRESRMVRDFLSNA